MCCHRYLALQPGHIRLLRLLPDPCESSPIRCELLSYPLLESKGSCPYESLSYAWSSVQKPCRIFIDRHSFSVGANLHAALVQLRDGYVERTLWVDAICIQQDDIVEKADQIELMPRIYAKATRTIVWLGGNEDGGERGLELFCEPATQPNASKHVWEHPEALALLRRPWFRRIWVCKRLCKEHPQRTECLLTDVDSCLPFHQILQEVAAARHIVIKCGNAEIDGSAFCKSLEHLDLCRSYFPELQAAVGTVVRLMKDAPLRSRRNLDGERFSLDILPLSKLIGLAGTHQATQRHDKVYALFGMCSDDPRAGEPPLLVDYRVPWSHLFHQVVSICFSNQVSVKTWDDKDFAVIKGRGICLGRICLQPDRLGSRFEPRVRVEWRAIIRQSRLEFTYGFGPLESLIREGDMVCLLEGCMKPSVVRLEGDYWTIVTAACSFSTDDGLSITDLAEVRELAATSPGEALLVWDWETPQRLGAESYPEVKEQTIGPDTTDHLLMRHWRLHYQQGNGGVAFREIIGQKATGWADSELRGCAGDLSRALNVVMVYGYHLRDEGAWWLEEATYKVHGLAARALNGVLSRPLSAELQQNLERSGSQLDILLASLIRPRDGWSPLEYGVASGHEKFVRWLFSVEDMRRNGRPVEQEDYSAFSTRAGGGNLSHLLAQAAAHGHMGVAQALLERGAGINMFPESRGITTHITPLESAIETGQVSMVEFLLEQGADPSLVSFDVYRRYSDSSMGALPVCSPSTGTPEGLMNCQGDPISSLQLGATQSANAGSRVPILPQLKVQRGIAQP